MCVCVCVCMDVYFTYLILYFSFIRYLATGCTFKDIHFHFRIGPSTARKIVKEVCQKIWEHLHELCIPELKQDDWLKLQLRLTTHYLCFGAQRI